MLKHELVITKTNSLTGESTESKEYFFSIYNAQRREAEVLDAAYNDPGNIKTKVVINKHS